MTASVTHTKVSGVSDGPDTSMVQPSDWNAGHTFSGFSTSATAFPTSPAPSAGDRIFRTDLGLDCYYDGTRWLSVQEFWSDQSTPSSTGTLSATTSATLTPRQAAIYITTFIASVRVSGTNTGAAYWTYDLSYIDTGANATTALGSLSTQSMSFTNPLFALLSATINTAISAESLGVANTKVGTPGTCYNTFRINYRLIVT